MVVLAIPGMCAYGCGKAVGEYERGRVRQVRWGRGRHGLLDDATCAPLARLGHADCMGGEGGGGLDRRVSR